MNIGARPSRHTTLRVVRPQRAVRRPVPAEPADTVAFAPDPYVDYARYLTAEGGLAITYKDIDERWRHHVRRFFLWAGATGAAAWLVLHHSPVHSLALNIVAIIIAGIINWLIVRKPVEVYRRVEIRPDCMVIDGNDVFWLAQMETWPTFGPGEDNTQVLSGIYGTRRVDYLTVRPFDEFDCTPMVLAAHLHEAMTQLWSWPY